MVVRKAVATATKVVMILYNMPRGRKECYLGYGGSRPGCEEGRRVSKEIAVSMRKVIAVMTKVVMVARKGIVVVRRF